MDMKKRIGRLLLVAIGAGFAAPGIAQEFPARPIRYVVPNSPGTAVDMVARLMAPEMSRVLGQSVVVENKPGANETIGYEFVAKQMPADGYTIVIAAVSSLAILPFTVRELRLNTLADLPPLMNLVEGRYFFGSPSTAPWKSFAEMVAHARTNPGRLNYGGANPTVRFWKEAIVRELGIDVVYVPYREGARYLQALAAGEVQMGAMAESSAMTLGARFRPLAVTGSARNPAYPDVPTFRELGLSQIGGINYSLNVRAGTPKPVMDRLHAAASAALKQPEVKTALAKFQLEIVGDSPEAAARVLQDQGRLFADIAKKAGIVPE